jgi:hypothetical protein
MPNMDRLTGTVVLLCVVAGMVWWSYARSRSILSQWAKDHSYEILESEYRFFLRGPFFWFTAKSQTVFFVKIRDPDGNIRTGWVRCGGWWLGLLSEKAEVKWKTSP